MTKDPARSKGEFLANPTLKKIPLFSGLEDRGLQKVDGICRRQLFRKNQLLFRQGETAQGFYVVETGRIKVYRLSLQGQEYVMRIVGPGETLAEAAVFSGDAYPASAEALEPSKVYYISKADFLTLIREDPQLALNMMTGLSLLLRDLAQQVDDLSLKEVPGRLARFLLTEAEKATPLPQDGLELTLPLRKNVLASRLGTIGETLSRTLNKLQQKGLIEIRKNVVKILHLQRLRQIAEGGKL